MINCNLSRIRLFSAADILDSVTPVRESLLTDRRISGRISGEEGALSLTGECDGGDTTAIELVTTSDSLGPSIIFCSGSTRESLTNSSSNFLFRNSGFCLTLVPGQPT